MGLLDNMKSMVETAGAALKSAAAQASIEPMDKSWLLPIRASFVPDFFEAFRPDEVIWIPKYDEQCFECGQLFEGAQLTPALLAALHGRTVFLQTRFSTAFGVLAVDVEDGQVQVCHVKDGMCAASSARIGNVESLGLARLREPAGEELTHERIVESEEFNARMKGLTYDGAAILREAEALRRLAVG